MLRRCALLLALALAVLLPTGCDDRKPMPVITIVVLKVPGQYLVNQQSMDDAALDAELRKVANENRREITGQVRAYINITSDRGVDYYRTDDVVDRCTRLGFMNITRADTGMK
jgi:biopolymer transport protein ExbD